MTECKFETLALSLQTLTLTGDTVRCRIQNINEIIQLAFISYMYV